MASPPRTREEERRLNARTLAIASAASASAAAVTSQLWIAGTWIAAAVTPLIVALVSELLHRPTERLARAVTSDRPALVLSYLWQTFLPPLPFMTDLFTGSSLPVMDTYVREGFASFGWYTMEFGTSVADAIARNYTLVGRGNRTYVYAPRAR